MFSAIKEFYLIEISYQLDIFENTIYLIRLRQIDELPFPKYFVYKQNTTTKLYFYHYLNKSILFYSSLWSILATKCSLGIFESIISKRFLMLLL